MTAPQVSRAQQTAHLRGAIRRRSVIPEGPETTFSTNEVAHIAGVSLRQLQWASERGVFNVPHLAHRRVWTERDLFDVCVIADLRSKELSLQAIRRLLKTLKRIDLEKPSGRFLLTDGRSGFLLDTPEQVVKFIARAKAGVRLVSLSDVMARIRNRTGRAA